jgi:hypothetical protein
MAAYGTFKVADNKCATCNFYQGSRRFGMVAYKPRYVYADVGQTPCIANTRKNVSAVDRCSAWQRWVSIPEDVL